MTHENEQLFKIEKEWVRFKEMLGKPIPAQLDGLIREIDAKLKQKNVEELRNSFSHLSSTLAGVDDDIGPLKSAFDRVLENLPVVQQRKSHL